VLGIHGRSMSETQILQLRDHLYDVAQLAIDAAKALPGSATPPVCDCPPGEDREAIEERAAILEFEAGMTRRTADRLTWRGVLRPQKAVIAEGYREGCYLLPRFDQGPGSKFELTHAVTCLPRVLRSGGLGCSR